MHKLRCQCFEKDRGQFNPLREHTLKSRIITDTHWGQKIRYKQFCYECQNCGIAKTTPEQDLDNLNARTEEQLLAEAVVTINLEFDASEDQCMTVDKQCNPELTILSVSREKPTFTLIQ